MGLPNSNPQVLVYWVQIVIALPCIGLLGNHAGIGPLAYCVAVSVILAIGTVLFMLFYTSRRTRPKQGRSIFKICEMAYQLIAWFLYLVIIGIYSSENHIHIDQSRSVVHVIQIFTSLNWGAYLFGAMLSSAELVWESAEEFQKKREKNLQKREAPERPTLPRETTTTEDSSTDVKAAKQYKPHVGFTAHPVASAQN
ncbi:hypothetical protein Ciccas_004511 [Cichlidogyrus casuarinus]|uniref:MARVEL domain-containing protein n=1 Tax=Cichlidogyrus casuarinus TaxID=1844966 RepID=A0ABD2QBC3_9PLAT